MTTRTKTRPTDSEEVSGESRTYECLVLIPLDLSERELKQAQGDIEGLFEEKGGKLLSKELWSRRGLAYKIKGKTEGRYILYYVDLKPEAVSDIGRTLRLEPHVLRHLLIRTPKGYVITSFEERFQDWQNQHARDEEEERVRKEEELKRRIVRKAVKLAPSPQDAAPKKEVAPGEKEIETEIGRLISGEDLENL